MYWISSLNKTAMSNAVDNTGRWTGTRILWEPQTRVGCISLLFIIFSNERYTEKNSFGFQGNVVKTNRIWEYAKQPHSYMLT
jgi:hypothetical protein